MKVSYTGKADFQEFSAADFKKAGIENQNKVRFARGGDPVEVSDEAGQALISDEGLFGRHSFEEYTGAEDKNSTDDPEGVEENSDTTPQTKVSSGKRGKAADSGTV